MSRTFGGVLLLAGALAACGGGTGDADRGASADGPEQEQAFTLVGTSGAGLPVAAPVCVDERINWGCPNFSFLDCDGQGQQLDLDPAANAHCAICVDPTPGAPTACEPVREGYNEFVAGFISRTCGNYCDPENNFGNCAKHVITNACGTVVVSLAAETNEETLFMAREYAQERCEVACDGVAPGTALSVDAYRSVCVDHQCVLILEDAPGGGPDAPHFPDAVPLDASSGS